MTGSRGGRRSIEPTDALAPPGAVLTEAQVTAWREEGFALVDGVLPEALVARAREDAAAAFPSAGSAESEQVNDFGSLGRMDGPE